MQIYIILFLNFIFFSILKYAGFSVMIEKLNYIAIFNTIILYFFAIYNVKVYKIDFYIHPINIFILISLISYNSTIGNNSMLVSSSVLLALFFILENIYNRVPIKINTNYKDNNAEQRQTKNSWDDIKHTYEEKINYTHFEKEKEEHKKEEFIYVDIELELKLSMFDLEKNYTLKQLKKAYKDKAKKSHPDKFSKDRQETQTHIMKEINDAKSYLEDRLK